MLTQQQIDVIRSTFMMAVQNEDAFAQQFYSNLFDIAPQVRAMFPADMTQQRSKLSHMLAFIVRRLHVPGELVKPVENLGIRHTAYGAEASHYPVVGEAILKTFHDVLGEAWTQEAKEAWTVAYTFVAETMISAAASAPAPVNASTSSRRIC